MAWLIRHPAQVRKVSPAVIQAIWPRAPIAAAMQLSNMELINDRTLITQL
jgi:hypothetical protein